MDIGNGFSGINTLSNYVTGYGDADGWGGPDDGVDVLNHIGVDSQGKTYKVPSDVYMFLMVIGALAVLWFLGGVVFKNARL